MRSRRRLPTTRRNRSRRSGRTWTRTRSPRREEDMIQISESAARKIPTLMAKQGVSEGGLRVGVKGGGCSGLSYTFTWDRQARTGDETFDGPDGAKIYVDKKS